MDTPQDLLFTAPNIMSSTNGVKGTEIIHVLVAVGRSRRTYLPFNTVAKILNQCLKIFISLTGNFLYNNFRNIFILSLIHI